MTQEENDLWSDIHNDNNDASMDDWANYHNDNYDGEDEMYEYSQSDLDNHSNQLNPNNDEYKK